MLSSLFILGTVVTIRDINNSIKKNRLDKETLYAFKPLKNNKLIIPIKAKNMTIMLLYKPYGIKNITRKVSEPDIYINENNNNYYLKFLSYKINNDLSDTNYTIVDNEILKPIIQKPIIPNKLKIISQ